MSIYVKRLGHVPIAKDLIAIIQHKLFYQAALATDALVSRRILRRFQLPKSKQNALFLQQLDNNGLTWMDNRKKLTNTFLSHIQRELHCIWCGCVSEMALVVRVAVFETMILICCCKGSIVKVQRVAIIYTNSMFNIGSSDASSRSVYISKYHTLNDFPIKISLLFCNKNKYVIICLCNTWR